jgi:Family of unknown function (DUF6281)
VWHVLLAVALAVLAACGNGDDGHNAESCADSVTLGGAGYLGTGDTVGTAGHLQLGDELGPAVRPACDDGGSEDGIISERETGTEYALVGIDERWAIAFGSSRADATIYVVNGEDVPSEVQTKLRATT